jgi:asparagine synthase (glutamine-hydrolysing)
VDALELDPRTGLLNRYLFIDQNYYLPDDILYKADRMSMAHSLEVRPPFLDHRIVEFAASLPEHLKIRGLKQKVILKELMRGKLPPAVIRRKKTGFDIPAHDWFRGSLKGLVQDTLSADTVAATGIFDARAIGTLIRDHMERRINVGYHLWGLLTLFLWMKRWKVEIVPAAETERSSPVPVFATR